MGSNENDAWGGSRRRVLVAFLNPATKPKELLREKRNGSVSRESHSPPAHCSFNQKLSQKDSELPTAISNLSLSFRGKL